MLSAPDPTTHFAPAARMPESRLDDLISGILREPIVHSVLAAIDGFVVLLNKERQILAANQAALDFLGVVDASELLGKRPGEAFNCIHHREGPGGCGTSRHCAHCGAVLAILASQVNKEPVDGECRLTRRVNESLEAAEFKVRSTPLKVGSKTIWTFVLHDISAFKRKDALERLFVHDLMNILGGLLGYVELWEAGGNTDVSGVLGEISKLVKRLHAEVAGHGVLMHAEQGDLEVTPAPTTPDNILSMLKAIFSEHETARDRNIEIPSPSTDEVLLVDESLLLRILSNMIKNALEATRKYGTVTAWYENTGEGPGFFVKNEGVMSEPVALRVFQRSFSTKSAHGRGLGTYGMKLIGEKYLRGKVGFRSTKGEGTVFFILLPEAVA